ncbi:MAG TPA: SDR family oxidoreductase [Dongiaceae bacterium]|jgi:3-oxoacyl-[acyl-carrier protein] reductase
MDLLLKGRTALVTGASQGIGRTIALGLAKEGAQVAVAARRGDLLAVLCDAIRAAGDTPAVQIECDLYRDNAPEQLAAAALGKLKRVDILVNAAGGSRPLPFEGTKEQWEEGMLLNFWRLRELTHALAPQMRENQFGRIINLTGTSEPTSFNAASTAKAAVHAWSKGFSREFARFGITINCIQPGRIRSEQIDRKYPTEESRQEFFSKEIPAQRFGQPEELADLAVFLASPRASYITGTVIPVDGGMSRFAF